MIDVPQVSSACSIKFPDYAESKFDPFKWYPQYYYEYNDDKIRNQSLQFVKSTTPGKIHFLIGSTRSGKSTFSNNWETKVEIDEFGCMKPRVVINTDRIRLGLHGERYRSNSEPQVFALKHYFIKYFYESGYSILVDGTHTTETSIRRILEVDPNATYTVFDTDADTCKQRAIATGQDDLLPVIDRHHAQLQVLIDEGIDNVIKRLNADIKARRGQS